MAEEIYSDEYFMRMALKEATLALEEDEVPIGAVVVMGGKKVIAKGRNRTEKLNDVTAHAEMLALTSASEYIGAKYLHDCTLYVTIEPCPMCAAALGWSQIDKVVYGAPDEKRGYTKFSPVLLHPKTQVIGNVMGEDCAQLMKRFFSARRKPKL